MEFVHSPMTAAEFAMPVARAQRKTASGELIWKWIAFAFIGYWTMFVAGAYLNKQELNNVGGLFLLAVLLWSVVERLWVRLDTVAIVALFGALMPVLNAFAFGSVVHIDSLVKHVSLYLVIAISRMLVLPAAYETKMRMALVIPIVIVLAICGTTDRGNVWDGGTRHSGLFANPNNLALVPFLLIFFIDRRRDSAIRQLCSHAMVVAVQVLAATSGAVVAYGIGLALHYGSLVPRKWRGPLAGVAVVVGLAGLGVVVTGGSFLPQTRLTKQISVMTNGIDTLMSGRQIAYYEQEKVLGPGSASAIWRLAHWQKTFLGWADGNTVQHLMGYGIGASQDMMGKMPHNEYLRALFEQGIVGFCLFMFSWGGLIATAHPDVRYCGFVVAMYSFSENNIDNFPFMILFILGLSAGRLGANLNGRTLYTGSYQ